MLIMAGKNLTKMKSRYQWQGVPVKVKFGYVDVVENAEKPLYWYNFECYNKQELDGSWVPNHYVKSNGLHFAHIPSIRITCENQTFLLANHFGIGVHKLLNGGWPGYRHFSIDGTFHESDLSYHTIRKFDLLGFEEYEEARNKWQKKLYPVEYNKLQLLIQGVKKLTSD